jgi:hypothetical protein
MPMMKAAASPDAFVEELDGGGASWSRRCARRCNAGAEFDELIKWGNLVFAHNGLCILIHVRGHRVVLGFLRGKRLTALEPRIRPSGKYELGNVIFYEGDTIEPAQVEAPGARGRAAEPRTGRSDRANLELR